MSILYFVAVPALLAARPFSVHEDTLVSALQPLREFGSARLVPTVDCVRVISLVNSSLRQRILAEAHRVGLGDRLQVQEEIRDPEGGFAGVYRAHMRAAAAGLARGCAHQFVLEDDTFFDMPSVAAWNASAERFLRSGRAYDMLFAGWPPALKTHAERAPFQNCSLFRLHNWVDMHAYILSKESMRYWSEHVPDWGQQPVSHLLRFGYGQLLPIDVLLAQHHDRGRFYAPRPSVAIQADHVSTIGGNDTAERAYQVSQSHPAYVHRQQDAILLQPSDRGADGDCSMER